MKTRSENIQPFILALGNQDFSSFEKFLVYLDGAKLAFTSFLRSVDICFKSFHLFNLHYPIACSQLWTFIEIYFYKLNKVSTKKTSKICILIEELEKN